MNARLFNSFATELLKMAADLEEPQDAGIRELLALRRGDENYLPGGRLLTNSVKDTAGIDYTVKVADDDTGAINLSSGVYDLPSRKKKKNHAFQHTRDYLAAGAKGAFVGIGATEAHQKLIGQFTKPEAGPAAAKMGRRFRTAAGLGAAASVLERAYRYNHLKKHPPSPSIEKQAIVAPIPGGSGGMGSPAQAFQRTRRTGMFEASKVHTPRVTQFSGH